MSRYRPPMARGSRYITREGYQRLRAELQTLWQQKRPEVVKALAAAAAEGDRSENAEYIYRKKQLGSIDRRVRYLRKRLAEVQVVARLPDDPDKIFFGAWVVIDSVEEAGGTSRYRIVGPDEIDAERGWISIDSPVARVLLGRRAGDAVTVDRPAGEARLKVVEVFYDNGAETTTE